MLSRLLGEDSETVWKLATNPDQRAKARTEVAPLPLYPQRSPKVDEFVPEALTVNFRRVAHELVGLVNGVRSTGVPRS